MRRTGSDSRYERELGRKEWETIAIDVSATLWRGRVELALGGVLTALTLLLGQWTGGVLAVSAVVAVVGGTLVVRQARHRIVGWLGRVRVRRAWDDAVLDTGAARQPASRSTGRLPSTPWPPARCCGARATRLFGR